MFSLPESQTTLILHGEYSDWIVVLSIIIACCASYTAISMNQRIQQNSFFDKKFWLLLASLAMGLGIWSMHFIGMSAFMLPIEMHYNVFLTIVSIFPAVFASYLAFYFANRSHKTYYTSAISGMIMGFGISSMHYIGMAAMVMEAHYFYKPRIFIASIIIAIVVSYVALFTFSRLQKYMGNQLIKVVTSTLMGLAITSMHYTGMAAVVFYVEEPLAKQVHLHKMDTLLIVMVISVGISLLLLISGLTSILDRYVDHRITNFDSLTLLPNQRQFEKDINRTISNGSLAIIHIHNLEAYTSVHGYEFGEQIIKAAGEIIQSLKPISTNLYRIEEARFAILDFNGQDDETMKISVERMLSVFSKPMKAQHYQISLEMVCAFSHIKEKAAGRNLFSNTMAVLQHPSVRYKNEVVEYDPAIHTYSFEQRILEDISEAISNQELFLMYQPKVCPKTLELKGAEALLRWRHPDHGLISPGIFIPILEKSEKLHDVTDWVIEEVCRQLSVWIKDEIHIGSISINIPGTYITSTRLLEVTKENLVKYAIDSDLLELEITETSVIHDIENGITALDEFRKLGLSVALDDFGTGLSSLSYLRRLPITTIKLDKSFVDGVPSSARDSSLLSAIITLCHSLQLPVVIEGVESKDQIDYIMKMAETPYIQGHYFSGPLEPKELLSWINRETVSKQFKK
jgi:diguanylate cyclase